MQLDATSAYNLSKLPILVAKATTMRQGVYTAIQSEYKSIYVEGDNKILIQGGQGRDQCTMVDPHFGLRYIRSPKITREF